ncbi:hypothetical protein RA263_30110, partial [Pseudomonas syringae pv. tagetis]
MPLQKFAGTFETDDYIAALYIVKLLLSNDTELSPEDYKNFVIQLRGYLNTLKESANHPIEALRSLQQMAERNPENG